MGQRQWLPYYVCGDAAMTTPEVRMATETDLPAIDDIHRHYVLNTTCTYALEPLSTEAREDWFRNRPEYHPVTVVESDGQVVAWGALGMFRTLGGYQDTVENSVYVHPNHVRQGFGSLVISHQIELARQMGLRSIIAVVDSQQAASLAVHKKHGFVEVGRVPHAARKFDTWLDIVILQVAL